MVKVGIIGGSGLDDPNILKDAKEISVETPYGPPTSVLVCGSIEGVDVAKITVLEPGVPASNEGQEGNGPVAGIHLSRRPLIEIDPGGVIEPGGADGGRQVPALRDLAIHGLRYPYGLLGESREGIIDVIVYHFGDQSQRWIEIRPGTDVKDIGLSYELLSLLLDPF